LLDQVDEAIAYGGTADRNMPDLVVHGGDLALLDEQPQDTFSSQKGTFVDTHGTQIDRDRRATHKR